MYDRDVEFSQRYQLKKVEGTDDIFDLIPAPGTVNNEGTLINKAALLKDMTAALFGLTTDAVPDDVFKILTQASLYKTVTPTAQLGTLPDGSIIYLNENGAPVPFYVAKQGYEPDYNTDRVLLVRKDAVQAGAWNSSGVNTYDGSTIDTWMNGAYLQTLDNDVQIAIGTTNIPATSPRNSGVIRLNKAVFALSSCELGATSGIINTEGSVLPTASYLKTTYLGGELVEQWTRSPRTDDSTSVVQFGTDGEEGFADVSVSSFYAYRPAFTLPADFTVYSDSPTTGLYDVSDNLLLKLPGVQIETGSYVGTGTYGSSNPNSLTFGFVPKVILINASTTRISSNYNGILINGGNFGLVFRNIRVDDTTGAISGCSLLFSDTNVSWYNIDSAVYQLNESGITYTYTAIG